MKQSLISKYMERVDRTKQASERGLRAPGPMDPTTATTTSGGGLRLEEEGRDSEPGGLEDGIGTMAARRRN